MRFTGVVVPIVICIFTGFVMAYMVSKLGVRVVTIASGLMLSTGILMTAFARDIIIIYICYGVIAGTIFYSYHLIFSIIKFFVTNFLFRKVNVLAKNVTCVVVIEIIQFFFSLFKCKNFNINPHFNDSRFKMILQFSFYLC